jgi:hypothetical protein
MASFAWQGGGGNLVQNYGIPLLVIGYSLLVIRYSLFVW